MRLVVTRPESDGPSVAAKLEALGHQALLAPLLLIVPRDSAIVPDRRWQAVALSSANAARALRDRFAIASLASVPAYTVGQQSAAAAREAGFATVRAEGGSAAALAIHLADTLDPRNGPILYLSGDETAGDLTGMLRESGFEVERIVLYEARAASSLPRDVIAALEAKSASGVLLYSPRTASIWRGLAGKHSGELMHYCLSANVAAALSPKSPRRVAARPEERALLDLLKDA